MNDRIPLEFKPIVHYEKNDNLMSQVQVGKPAVLFPVDHTSPFVSNTMLALTSRVVSFDPLTGEIETENTCYIPQPEVPQDDNQP